MCVCVYVCVCVCVGNKLAYHSQGLLFNSNDSEVFYLDCFDLPLIRCLPLL